MSLCVYRWLGRSIVACVAISLLACTPKSSRDHVDGAPSATAAPTSTSTGGKDSASPDQGSKTMKLSSPAFAANGNIPAKYTCQGDDISPPLSWTDAPAGTKAFALIVDDPDAPDPAAPKMTWVHWVLFNLPSATNSLPENAGKAPSGAQDGLNDWKKTGYGGPCPPVGKHRYFFKLYALDAPLSGLDTPTKAQLEAAMKGHVLAETQLIGLYQKK